MICSSEFIDLLNSDIIPLSGMATISGAMVIAAAYMFSEATANDKIRLWAKTELFQIVISVIAVLILVQLITGFCDINVNDVAKFFGLATLPFSGSGTIFDGARAYLVSAADFGHKVVAVERYYLSAIQMLNFHSLWECNFFCLFGPSGTNVNPDAGYSSILPGINLAFSTALFAYLSSLNYLFILLFIDSGLVLFLLPFGIFLRSMPFMRHLGSLLIAVATSFMLVYPVVLASFYLIFNDLFVFPADLQYYVDHEDAIADISGFSGSLDFSSYVDEVFPTDDPNEFEAMKIAGASFLAGVFIPTIAMLAAIASVRFISRLLGEEIDLSRIVQMV